MGENNKWEKNHENPHPRLPSKKAMVTRSGQNPDTNHGASIPTFSVPCRGGQLGHPVFSMRGGGMIWGQPQPLLPFPPPITLLGIGHTRPRIRSRLDGPNPYPSPLRSPFIRHAPDPSKHLSTPPFWLFDDCVLCLPLCELLAKLLWAPRIRPFRLIGECKGRKSQHLFFKHLAPSERVLNRPPVMFLQ